MRTLAALFLSFVFLALPGLSATHKKRRLASGRSSASTKPGAVTSGKPSTSLSKGKTGTKIAARSRKPRQTWRTRQTIPTPERYKEIQQALIEKGYLQGPPSGVWGPDCTQALKKFQQDQSLEPSGKLDSLSIISLGLGPRREPVGSTALLVNPAPESAVRDPQ